MNMSETTIKLEILDLCGCLLKKAESIIDTEEQSIHSMEFPFQETAVEFGWHLTQLGKYNFFDEHEAARMMNSLAKLVSLSLVFIVKKRVEAEISEQRRREDQD